MTSQAEKRLRIVLVSEKDGKTVEEVLDPDIPRDILANAMHTYRGLYPLRTIALESLSLTSDGKESWYRIFTSSVYQPRGKEGAS